MNSRKKAPDTKTGRDMNINVLFGNQNVVVSCGEGNINIKELTELARKRCMELLEIPDILVTSLDIENMGELNFSGKVC